MFDHRVHAIRAPFMRIAGRVPFDDKNIGAVAPRERANPRQTGIDRIIDLINVGRQQAVDQFNHQRLNIGQAGFVLGRGCVRAQSAALPRKASPWVP